MKSEIRQNWSGFENAVEFSIEYALLEMGKTITRYVRSSLMRPGTGRWYYSKRYRRYGAMVVAAGKKTPWKSFFKSKEARTLFRTPMAFRYGLMHQASVPGATPAPDTELLCGSIDFEVASKGSGWKTLFISANAPYAKHLELGVSTFRVRILPRPFLRPAVYRSYHMFGQEMMKAFRASIVGRASGHPIIR